MTEDVIERGNLLAERIDACAGQMAFVIEHDDCTEVAAVIRALIALARKGGGEDDLERAARAICEAGTEEPGLCFRDDDPHETKCIRSCVACRNVARAVVAALSSSQGGG